MTNAQGDFIWYELMTPDPEGARAFYGAVAGLEIGDAPPAPAPDYRMIGYGGSFVGGMLAMDDDMLSAGAMPMWIGYIGVDDVDATAAGIRAKGGHIFVPPRDIPGTGRFAMAADPQGAPFYIMRGFSDATSTVWQDNEVGHWGWNELWTPDQAGALDFYGSLFGWTQAGAMPMGPRGDYLFMMQDGKRLGAFGPKEPGVQAYWRHIFRVPSIGAALKAAKAGGATEIEGPHEVPGGDHVLYGRDPQGATFVLVGGK